MDKNLLKQSIEEWQAFYSRSRESLVLRGVSSLPQAGLAAALIGVRRGGKTFQAIEMSLSLPVEKVLYYNFEDPLFYLEPEVGNLDLLLAVASEFHVAPIELLILDEIQNINGWERWLRKLIDQKRYRIIVTGSSARLLSRELSTALTGRALTQEVSPLGYGDFLEFQQRKPETLNEHRQTFRAFLRWGGFPEVTLMSEPVDKTRLLRQYLGDIMLRDILSRYEIRNKQALDTLAVYYLSNTSSLHTQGSLKKAFGFSADLIADYTEALCDAFAIFQLERFNHKLKQQSRDPRKIYAIDTGLRNACSRSASDDTGKLLENVVFLELRRRGHELYYYKGKYEVDFLVTEHYQPRKLIQVCAELAEESTRKRELRALEEAMTELGLQQAELISMDRDENVSLPGGREVKITSACKWLL